MEYDVLRAEAAQNEYAKTHECPMFAPDHGWCPGCGRNIYKTFSVEEAGKKLITGCPICGYSFVE